MALGEGALVVNSSRGGGSKDTWVLAGRDEPAVTADLGDVADAALDVPSIVEGIGLPVQEPVRRNSPIPAAVRDSAAHQPAPVAVEQPRDPGPASTSSSQQQQQQQQ